MECVLAIHVGFENASRLGNSAQRLEGTKYFALLEPSVSAKAYLQIGRFWRFQGIRIVL